MKIPFVIITLIIFQLICIGAYGQSDPLLRIEIDVKSDAATYKLASCGKNGLVLFYETTMQQDDYKFWAIVLYNRYMQEAWKKDVPILENMSYKEQETTGNYLYVLFHDAEKKKSETYNYQVLKLDVTKGNYELFSGEIPNKAQIVDFKIINSKIIVGINIDDDASGIYSFNTITHETSQVFKIDYGNSRFEGLFIDTLKNTFAGVFNVYVSKSEYYLLMKEFDTLGTEISGIKITPEPGKKFNSARIINGLNNERLVFGTYDIVKGKSIDSKDYFTKQSSGFYTSRIIEDEHTGSLFYNFLDLENMTGYLKSKEYQQARKKAGKSEDKEKHSVDFDLIVHDIKIRDSLYYFTAEAFFEEYHTVTNTYYDYYGHAVPVSYAVFDGYKYFNAFIACFDDKGNKMWDNGMEIFDILTFVLKKRVNVYFDNDDIVMAYNREGKIGAKIINGPDVIEGVEYFPLETSYVNDKIMSDSKSNMEFWYDNYFIAYGFQTIKNNSLINNNKRTVFYINKLAFQ